jgi:hypothetical protein
MFVERVEAALLTFCVRAVERLTASRAAPMRLVQPFCSSRCSGWLNWLSVLLLGVDLEERAFAILLSPPTAAGTELAIINVFWSVGFQ